MQENSSRYNDQIYSFITGKETSGPEDIKTGYQGWADFLTGELSQPYAAQLIKELTQARCSEDTILPVPENVFKAFELTAPQDIRVVILGQDPYPTPGDAMGLAFSVKPGQKLPRSLKNIFKEIADETDTPVRTDGNLTDWAEQGVFLLNTTLTVKAHNAGSHRKLGWTVFTDNVISYLNTLDQPIVFMLWGNAAKDKLKLLNNPGHLVLTANHPSPLSAGRGFFGCGHFIKANEFLKEAGLKEIQWN